MDTPRTTGPRYGDQEPLFPGEPGGEVPGADVEHLAAVLTLG
ncbi:MAG TPA: hypothetical protein VKZ89_20985 [Thermobifida alba]|nr:hypothetical protein [Thermobifida alba]